MISQQEQESKQACNLQALIISFTFKSSFQVWVRISAQFGHKRWRIKRKNEVSLYIIKQDLRKEEKKHKIIHLKKHFRR